VDQVRAVYRKYDGALHWNCMTLRLGEDEHGVWLGAPSGTVLRRGEDHSVTWGVAHVLLMPREGWWTGAFNAAPHKTEIYCDISTTPVWPSADEVTMVDLDLDVRRRRTGEVELLDEDEFAEHQIRYGYPAEVVDSARVTAEWLMELVRARAEPFGEVYRHWLGQIG
jgi:protein associated with RNAse G/E